MVHGLSNGLCTPCFPPRAHFSRSSRSTWTNHLPRFNACHGHAPAPALLIFSLTDFTPSVDSHLNLHRLFSHPVKNRHFKTQHSTRASVRFVQTSFFDCLVLNNGLLADPPHCRPRCGRYPRDVVTFVCGHHHTHLAQKPNS